VRALILFLVLSVVSFSFYLKPKLQPTSWVKEGKLLSPFDFYQKKVLLSEQEGVERLLVLNNKFIDSLLSAFGWQADYKLEKGTKLNFVINPSCTQLGELKEEVGLNFELLNKSRKSSRLQPMPSLPIELSETTSLTQLEKQLAGLDCVIGVSNRRPLFLTARSGKDPLLEKQSYLKVASDMGMLGKLTKFEDSLREKIVIAVIDSGADINHPDLKPNLWVNTAEQKGRAGVDDDNNAYVDDLHGYDFSTKQANPSHKMSHDHGTHVAGLIAAAGNNNFGIRGILSEKVSLMVLNVTGKYHSAMPEDIEEAIYYAVKMGADIINISLGSPGRVDSIAHAIVYAVNNGVSVVSSVGNESINLDNSFYVPGSYAAHIPGLISVGAFDVIDGRKCGVSNYSNTFVEIMAPGCNRSNPQSGLLSLANDSNFKYRQGTSMAAPIVTGGLALMKAYHRDILGKLLSPAEQEALFLESAEQSPLLRSYVQEGRVFKVENLFPEEP
jgi:hypothetical protein